MSLILHSHLLLDLSDHNEAQIPICAMVSAPYLRKDPLTLLEFCLFLPVMTVTAFNVPILVNWNIVSAAYRVTDFPNFMLTENPLQGTIRTSSGW